MAGGPAFRRTEEYGFTLLEVVVMLVLLGTVAAIVVPRIGGGLLGSAPRLQEASDQLVGDLREARSRGMACGDEGGVAFAVTDGGWTLDAADEPCGPPREGSVSAGITLDAEPETTFWFRYPDGDLGRDADNGIDALEEPVALSLEGGDGSSRTLCVRRSTGAVERNPCDP